MDPSFEAFVDPSDGFHDKPGTPWNREGQFSPPEACNPNPNPNPTNNTVLLYSYK